MILVDYQIKKAITEGGIGVSPFDETLINPSSLDFRLGDHYTRVRPRSWNAFDGNKRTCGLTNAITGKFPSYGSINPLDKDSFINETFQAEEYWLLPQESILVSMYERLTLPSYITAEIKGKSSLARLGLSNSSEGGLLDPGWDGYITCELTNHSPNALKLTYKMKVGQLIFFKHEAAEKPYNISGRYYQQAEGQGSLGL